MSAKKYLSNKGYGKGSNFTTSTVEGLMEAYAKEVNARLNQEYIDLEKLMVSAKVNNVLLKEENARLRGLLERALPELQETLKEVGHDPAVGIDASELIDVIEQIENELKIPGHGGTSDQI